MEYKPVQTLRGYRILKLVFLSHSCNRTLEGCSNRNMRSLIGFSPSRFLTLQVQAFSRRAMAQSVSDTFERLTIDI